MRDICTFRLANGFAHTTSICYSHGLADGDTYRTPHSLPNSFTIGISNNKVCQNPQSAFANVFAMQIHSKHAK